MYIFAYHDYWNYLDSFTQKVERGHHDVLVTNRFPSNGIEQSRVKGGASATAGRCSGDITGEEDLLGMDFRGCDRRELDGNDEDSNDSSELEGSEEESTGESSMQSFIYLSSVTEFDRRLR